MRKLDEVREAVGDLVESQQAWTEAQRARLEEVKKDNDHLRERIEELESRRNSPGPTSGDGGRRPTDHKVYHVGELEIYELPSNVKAADVLGPAKPPEISFERWLAAALIGERCQDKLAISYAREKKQLVTTTTGILIPEEYQATWIDRIRSQMVLNAAGMTTIPMLGKILNASAVVTDPTASWHTEAAAISAANPTFAARTMSAETLVTRCQGSVEVSQDSPDFGAQLAGVMARAMAVALDRAGLIGSGTPPEPAGILNTSGRGQVTAVGALTDYAEIVQGVRLLLDANLPLEVATRVAIMSPRVWEDYEGLATGISGDKTQLPRPRSLEATRFLVTSNGLDVGSPLTSTIFLGDFSDLVLGVRLESTVEALKLTTYASNLILEFVGYLRADYMLRRPASFVTLEGVSV